MKPPLPARAGAAALLAPSVLAPFVLVSFVFVSFVVLVPGAAAQTLAGSWGGGFGSDEDGFPIWQTASWRIEPGPEGWSASALVRGELREASIELLDDGRLRWELPDAELGLLELTGKPEGDRWQGSFTGPRGAGEFGLVRELSSERAELEGAAGIYLLEGGERLALGVAWPHLVLPDGAPRLVAQNLDTGWVRVLFRRGPRRFTAGPRFAHPLPVTAELEIDLDPQAAGLRRLVLEGEAVPILRRFPHPEPRAVSFDVEGARLAGSLWLPPGEGPHPALIFVHGSGPQTRDAARRFWPAAFVERGLAFLAVDKRGVGQSSGSYALPDGRHDDEDHMARRARDVAQVYAELSRHPAIDGERVGLFGFSQAGWVIPRAAALVDPAFTLILGGGATALDVEDVFSRASGELWGSSEPIEAAYALLAEHEPERPTFAPILASQTSPGLWLYGDLDRSNPSRTCAEAVRRVARTHARPFDVVVFPGANHALWECRVGNGHEYGALRRVHPELYSTMWAWLEERGILP